MIIRYPTGLYRDALPINPEDSGNITFTISNTTPPRTNLIFPKIPAGLVSKNSDKPTPVDVVTNRQHFGGLIFSVSSSKRRDVGNNSRQFEIGQVLEFVSGEVKSVQPMLVNSITSIQHNTNTLDYDSLGMSVADQEIIATQSLLTQTSLTNQLNTLKRQRADAEIQVNVQQKVINEASRTIDALEIIAQTSSEVSGLIVNLKKKRDEAFKARDLAITNANNVAVQADAVLMQLRAVAVVVK